MAENHDRGHRKGESNTEDDSALSTKSNWPQPKTNASIEAFNRELFGPLTAKYLYEDSDKSSLTPREPLILLLGLEHEVKCQFIKTLINLVPFEEILGAKNSILMFKNSSTASEGADPPVAAVKMYDQIAANHFQLPWSSSTRKKNREDLIGFLTSTCDLPPLSVAMPNFDSEALDRIRKTGPSPTETFLFNAADLVLVFSSPSGDNKKLLDLIERLKVKSETTGHGFVYALMDESTESSFSQLIHKRGHFSWQIGRELSFDNPPAITQFLASSLRCESVVKDEGYPIGLFYQSELSSFWQLVRSAYIAQAEKTILKIENQGSRFMHFLEGIVAIIKHRRGYKMKCALSALLLGALVFIVSYFALISSENQYFDLSLQVATSSIAAMVSALGFYYWKSNWRLKDYMNQVSGNLSDLVPNETEQRVASWKNVEPQIKRVLESSQNLPSLKIVQDDLNRTYVKLNEFKFEVRKSINSARKAEAQF